MFDYKAQKWLRVVSGIIISIGCLLFISETPPTIRAGIGLNMIIIGYVAWILYWKRRAKFFEEKLEYTIKLEISKALRPKLMSEMVQEALDETRNA